MDLTKILHTSAAGMHVQGERMRIVAENLANAGSSANSPGEEPYRRKLITFSNELNAPWYNAICDHINYQ